MTHHYLPKSRIGLTLPPKVQPRKRVSLRGKDGQWKGMVAMVRMPNGQHRFYSAATLGKMQGAQQGGLKVQALGTGHRWSMETARKASLKRWKRLRKAPWLGEGVRLGNRRNCRPRTARAPLRAKYNQNPTMNIWFDQDMGKWYIEDQYGRRVLGESTALRKLGHLPKVGSFVPKPGTLIACYDPSQYRQYRRKRTV